MEKEPIKIFVPDPPEIQFKYDPFDYWGKDRPILTPSLLNPNQFDRARLRLGAWGVIKGRLLAEVAGEARAFGMLESAQDIQSFNALKANINAEFKHAHAALNPEERQKFIAAKRHALLEDMSIPSESRPFVKLHENGWVEFKAHWGYYFDHVYGRPWVGKEKPGYLPWDEPSYNNEDSETYW